MKRAIIVHRWAGNPKSDWYPWLKAELEKMGFQVSVPEMMGETEDPVIGNWVSKLSETVGMPDSDTYFIGHSIGCQSILRYLETVNTPVAAAVFVAGWFNLENLEDDETREVAKPWIETVIDLDKVKAVLPQSSLIISDNDPFGCFEENKKKFSDFVTNTIVVPQAGHFTEDDSCVQLPTVVEEFQKLYVESLKRALKNEGFPHVYDWVDEPGTDYHEHMHKGKVSFYVVKGGIKMNINGVEKIIKAGERLDVPVAILHAAKVGNEGCTFVVGEEIEGDS